MICTICRITRGCGYLHGFGHHPGTGTLAAFVLMGALAGAMHHGWLGAIVSAGGMLAVFGPMYLYGAHERARDYDRRFGHTCLGRRGSDEPSEAAHGTAREPNPPNAPSNQES